MDVSDLSDLLRWHVDIYLVRLLTVTWHLLKLERLVCIYRLVLPDSKIVLGFSRAELELGVVV